MKQTVYKVIVNNKLFLRTISRDLAERTAASARKDYKLEAKVIEAYEEYAEAPTEML